MTEPLRLFVAVEIPPPVQDAIEGRLAPLRTQLPRASWVRAGGRHLTLAFLGDTDPALVPALDRELAPAFAGLAPMELAVAGVGGFPERGACRVVWAGVSADGDLAALHAAVGEAVRRATSRTLETRPFRPHVTLARCRPPWPRREVERLAAGFGDVAGGFQADGGTLFESRLEPAGARHLPLSRYPLGGAA